MAITYFAITAADTASLDMAEPEAAFAAKARGYIHVFFDTGAPSTKWIIVGDDIALADSARLRSISTARKNAIITELQKSLNSSLADLAAYGRSLGRTFCTVVKLSAATVNAL